MDLWPHQTALIDGARDAYRQGSRAILLAMPTGAGKTLVGATLGSNASAKGSRVLWIAHRIELVRQAAASIRACGVRCGIVAPDEPHVDAPVQVASMQTLLARDLHIDADVLVADEAHHIVAPEFFTLRERYEDALVIGLTATPCRADGVGLHAAFTSIVAGPQPRELIASGHLVPAIVLAPSDATDHAAAHPLDVYGAHLAGRQAIVFCESVTAAKALAVEFSCAGIPAQCVDGAMDPYARAYAIESFRRGALQALTNVHVLTEGFDVRGVSGIILARKVSSELAYIQMTGRGMRCAEGKSDLIVVDLFGSSCALGILPDSDRTYSLEGRGVRASTGDDTIRQCKACGRIFPASKWGAAGCPNCGFVDQRRKDPKVMRRELVELQAANIARGAGQAKVDFLRAQLQRCATTITRAGVPMKPGAALVQFAKRFRHWPNEAMKVAAGWPTGEVRQ